MGRVSAVSCVVFLFLAVLVSDFADALFFCLPAKNFTSSLPLWVVIPLSPFAGATVKVVRLERSKA
jgi:hypothetical protein